MLLVSEFTAKFCFVHSPQHPHVRVKINGTANMEVHVFSWTTEMQYVNAKLDIQENSAKVSGIKS